MKFTQEIKDNWLKALKSGEYIQGTACLQYLDPKDGIHKHCCIGVLGDIHPDLINDAMIGIDKNPYEFLKNSIGPEITSELWKTNDGKYDENMSDYLNVIPLIESLPVEEDEVV